MKLSEFELNLCKTVSPNIIGVSSAGATGYIGKIFATAVMYNYGANTTLNIPKDLDSIHKSVLQAAPLYFTYVLHTDTINQIGDLSLADYYARYKAVDNLCWHILYPNKITPKIVLSNDYPYRDILEDDMFEKKIAISDTYSNIEFTHGVNRGLIYSEKQGHLTMPTLFCADFLAGLAYRKDLCAIAAEYPEYKLLDNVNNITEEHKNLLSAHGKTPYHRFNVPEFNKYVNKKDSALDTETTEIDQAPILDQEQYVNMFNSLNNRG